VSDGINETSPAGPDPGNDAESNSIPAPPEVVYGISIFQMEDDRPTIHVTGEPDLGQLQRLMAGALQNLNADITARKVVQAFEERERSRQVIRPR
jgi:hypothetical protein